MKIFEWMFIYPNWKEQPLCRTPSGHIAIPEANMKRSVIGKKTTRLSIVRCPHEKQEKLANSFKPYATVRVRDYAVELCH